MRRTLGKHLTKLQQMVGVAVPSLLIANLAAVGVIVAADREGRPAAGAAETAAARRQLAVITLPDGRRFLVDPSTARGQRAIREARAAGGTVSTFSVPVSAGNGSRPGAGARNEFKVPEVDGVIPIPAGGALGDALDAIITAAGASTTLPGGSGTSTTLPGGGDDLTDALTDLLEDTTQTVQDTLGLLGSTSSTLREALNPVLTTLPALPVPLPTVTTAPGTTPTPTTPTTAAPSGGGLLGNLGTTVSSVVNSVTTVPPPPPTTPTTAAPSPTTTICAVTVICL